jgi:hypothetical protein
MFFLQQRNSSFPNKENGRLAVMLTASQLCGEQNSCAAADLSLSKPVLAIVVIDVSLAIVQCIAEQQVALVHQ